MYSGNAPFSSCSNIDNISFGENLTTIPDYLFCGGSKYVLTLKLPENLRKIGKEAFQNFQNLQILDLPEGLDSIEANAFYGCNRLKIVNIPTTLKSIVGSFPSPKVVNIKDLAAWCNIDFEYYSSNPLSGSALESDASKQTCLYLNGKFITDLVIPDGVTEIKPHAFQSYQNLRSVVLPSSVKKVGKEAFNECIRLKYVDIGDGVTHLDEEAFSNCYYMEEFIIGSALQTADKYALLSFSSYSGSITNLKYIKVRATTPPKLTDLTYMPVTKAVLYVPKGRSSAYRSNSLWGTFTTIKEYDDSDTTLPLLTIHNSENGDVAVSVKKGKSYTLSIDVPEGKTLDSVTFNDTDVTDKITNNTYVTPAINSDSKISVIIK